MDNESTIETAFARAVRLAGGQSAFGRLIKRPQQTISDRLRNGQPLWAEDVLLVETTTGVSRYDLRPDVYRREPESAATSVALEGFVS